MTLELMFAVGILCGLVGIIYANLNKKINDNGEVFAQFQSDISRVQIDISAIETDIKWIKYKLK